MEAGSAGFLRLYSCYTQPDSILQGLHAVLIERVGVVWQLGLRYRLFLFLPVLLGRHDWELLE